jgi:DNA-binding XRE family transcriptional regulator
VKNAAEIQGRSGREEPFTPNEVSRRLGMNIKRLREGKSTPGARLTQAKMGAELWGVSASRMNQIEKGKENLSLKKIVEIAEYFYVDIYELFLRPGLTIIDRDKKQ